MHISQVIMATLPNIEIVSFLIVIITVKFGYKSLIAVYVYVFAQFLTYGFAQWVISYLYVWAILALVTCALRRFENRIVCTVISTLFGFLFGVLCSPVSFAMGGFGYGISWIISGLWFDFLHGCGNGVIMFLLYPPIIKALNKVL